MWSFTTSQRGIGSRLQPTEPSFWPQQVYVFISSQTSHHPYTEDLFYHSLYDQGILYEVFPDAWIVPEVVVSPSSPWHISSAQPPVLISFLYPFEVCFSRLFPVVRFIPVILSPCIHAPCILLFCWQKAWKVWKQVTSRILGHFSPNIRRVLSKFKIPSWKQYQVRVEFPFVQLRFH